MGDDSHLEDPQHWRDVLGGDATADLLLMDGRLRTAIADGAPDGIRAALGALRERMQEPAEIAALDAALASRVAFSTETVRPPGLGRFNGFGVGMYGRADHDPGDGTYVKTRFFSALWLPVIPLDSWLVQDADGGWYFLGHVPLSRRLRLWRLASVALLIAAAVIFVIVRAYDAAHVDLYVVNGLDIPVTVGVADERIDVPSQGRAELELTVGAVDVVCTGPAGVEIETLHQTLTVEHDAVIYNVVGAAPLYVEVVPYGGTERRAEQYASLTWHVGRSWVPCKRLECPFRSPPDSVKVKTGEIETRTASGLVDGGWRAAAWIAWEHESADQAASLVARVVCVSGATEDVVADAYDAVVALRAPRAAIPVIDEWVAENGGNEQLTAFRLLLEQPLPPLGPESMILSTRQRRETMDALRAEHLRTAYRPVTTGVDDASELSRFGGRPWLREGETWPVCGICNEPMPLVVQLDLSKLPGSTPLAGRSGVLQAFVCNRDCCDSEVAGLAVESEAKLVRILVDFSSGGFAPEDLSPEGWVSMPLVRWAESEDLPSLAELDGLLGEDAWKARVTYEDAELVAVPYPVQGDKLGGWPEWAQGVAYPGCVECGGAMEMVLQLGSNQHVPLAWGGDDSGVAHISVCPSHSDVPAFTWAHR